MIISLLSITVNFCVITITLTKKLMIYKWFLFNMACFDMNYAFCCLFFNHPIFMNPFSESILQFSWILLVSQLQSISQYLAWLVWFMLYRYSLLTDTLTYNSAICTPGYIQREVLFFTVEVYFSWPSWPPTLLKLLGSSEAKTCFMEFIPSANLSSAGKVVVSINKAFISASYLGLFIILLFCALKVHRKFKQQQAALLNFTTSPKLKTEFNAFKDNCCTRNTSGIPLSQIFVSKLFTYKICVHYDVVGILVTSERPKNITK